MNTAVEGSVITRRLVLTPHGFGRCEMNTKVHMRRVVLDEPFLGSSSLDLDNRSEIFTFGQYALLRVFVIAGAGLFSTMQFFASKAWGSHAYLMGAPGGESRFLIDLKEGSVDSTLLLVPEGFTLMKPWVDRIGHEQTELFEEEPAAWAAFEKSSVTTSGGIHSSVFLDLRRKKLLGLRLMAADPPGLFYDWELGDPIPE